MQSITYQLYYHLYILSEFYIPLFYGIYINQILFPAIVALNLFCEWDGRHHTKALLPCRFTLNSLPVHQLIRATYTNVFIKSQDTCILYVYNTAQYVCLKATSCLVLVTFMYRKNSDILTNQTDDEKGIYLFYQIFFQTFCLLLQKTFKSLGVSYFSKLTNYILQQCKFYITKQSFDNTIF